MNAIMCVDYNWQIGRDDQLLYHIKDDLCRFWLKVKGKTVIVGRKTFETIQNLKALSNVKQVIVITQNPAYKVISANTCIEVVHSVEEALAATATTDPKEIYVIGGASIYHAFLPYCTTIYVTKVFEVVANANRSVDNLDTLPDWTCTWKSVTLYDSEKLTRYQFCIYNKIV